jgi:glycosyltransferase involved in cell wall biosynthesis
MKTRLKILQLHWGFPPMIGGVETHLTILLPEMVRMGHDVSLLTGSFAGEKENEVCDGVRVHRTPLFDLNWLVKRGVRGLEPDLEKLYRERIDAASPDVIHAHNMHYFSAPHAQILDEIARAKGIPLFLTAHNVWDDTLFLNLTRDIQWSHIIAVSHYIRMELLGVGVDDSRTTTIHHGLNLSKFRPGVTPEETYARHPQLRGKQVVFHPARIGMAKGCDVTIKAMRRVLERFPNAVLVLAGSKNIIDWVETQEKEIAYFIDLIRILGIERNVLIDVFSLDEMPGMYQAADVVVYPSSQAEPFGLTMLESMASARPIIVTRMGGMPEVIQDEISGYVIAQRSFETLADRICLLLDDDRLRTRLGATGRQIAEQHYTARIMTAKHLSVYENVLLGRWASVGSVLDVKPATTKSGLARAENLVNDAAQPPRPGRSYSEPVVVPRPPDRDVENEPFEPSVG